MDPGSAAAAAVGDGDGASAIASRSFLDLASLLAAASSYPRMALAFRWSRAWLGGDGGCSVSGIVPHCISVPGIGTTWRQPRPRRP